MVTFNSEIEFNYLDNFIIQLLVEKLCQKMVRFCLRLGLLVCVYYICNELRVCQGPISHNNEQTQSVEGII